jgi:farnesyl-diphosphate farnesyltransferase
MTNILKDIWEDRRRGACWLPREVFDQTNFKLKDPPGADDKTFGDGLEKLVAVARGHLENALAYTLLIPRYERGIRRFCLWALGMAVLTLRKIDHNPGFASGQEVKISRRSVRATIVVTRLSVGSNLLLKVLFNLAAFGLPRPATPPAPQSRRFQPYSLH